MHKVFPQQEIQTKVFANCGAQILSFLPNSNATVSKEFKRFQLIVDVHLLNAIKERFVPMFKNLKIEFTFEAIDLNQNVDALSTEISTIFSNLHICIKSNLGFVDYHRISKQYGRRDIATYNEICLTYNNNNINNIADGLCILARALQTQIPTIAIDNPESIRKWFKNNANLEALEAIDNMDLSNKGLKLLPPEIGRLVNLADLNLSNNQMDDLPEELLALEHLFICNLSSNYFSHNDPKIKALDKEVFTIGSQKKHLLPTLPQATSDGDGGGGGSK